MYKSINEHLELNSNSNKSDSNTKLNENESFSGIGKRITKKFSYTSTYTITDIYLNDFDGYEELDGTIEIHVTVPGNKWGYIIWAELADGEIHSLDGESVDKRDPLYPEINPAILDIVAADNAIDELDSKPNVDELSTSGYGDLIDKKYITAVATEIIEHILEYTNRNK